MPKTLTFTGFVDDRPGVSWDQPEMVKAHLRALLGDEIEVRIGPKRKRQGTQSMRYYRGVVIPDIARAMGYSDPDDFEAVHDAIAWKFLRIEDHPQFGTPRRRSTAKDEMNQQEMTDYIDDVIRWAEAEIVDCRVRRPHEVDLDRAPDFPHWDKGHAA